MTVWLMAAALAGGLALLALPLAWHRYLRGRRAAKPAGLPESLRQLQATIRFLARLAADPTLPPGVRLRLGAALIYLVLPVDRMRELMPNGSSRRRRQGVTVTGQRGNGNGPTAPWPSTLTQPALRLVATAFAFLPGREPRGPERPRRRP